MKGRALLIAAALALAAPALRAEEAACETEEGETPNPLQFDRHGWCLLLSGSVSLSYQGLPTLSDPALTRLANPRSPTPPGRHSGAASATGRADLSRETEAGSLSLAFEVIWNRALGDGSSGFGSTQVNEAYVALGGATAGYTYSLTGLWDGDILATANYPQRSVGILAYEHEISEGLKLAVALETASPSRDRHDDFLALTFEGRPFFVGRVQRTFDWGTLHLAGAVRREGFATATVEGSRLGYALTGGATVTVSPFGADDQISGQIAYARDALYYLGTAVDLGGLYSQLAGLGGATGWSAIGSYTRNWTDELASTAFLSHIALSGEGPLGLRSETRRYGVNLIWRPEGGWRIGAEVSRVEVEIERQPLLPVLDVARSGSATIVQVLVERSF
jgi:hypothetical protein